MSLLLNFLLLNAVVAIIANPGNPDCRIFVFAPKCRGVAAKRAPPVLPKEYIIGLRNLLKSLNGAEDWLTDDSRLIKHEHQVIDQPIMYDYEKK